MVYYDNANTQETLQNSILFASMSPYQMPSHDRVQQAAQVLGLSPAQLETWIRQGIAQDTTFLSLQPPVNNAWGTCGPGSHSAPPEQREECGEISLSFGELSVPRIFEIYQQNQTLQEQWSVVPPNDASGRVEDFPQSPCKEYSRSQSSGNTELTPSSEDSWVQVVRQQPHASGASNQHTSNSSLASTPPSQPPVAGLSKTYTIPPLRKRGRKPKKNNPNTSTPTLISSAPEKRRSRKHPSRCPGNPSNYGESEVCYPCRRSKKKCEPGSDPFGPCKACENKIQSPKTRVLCFRYHVAEVLLYRHQKEPHQRFSKRWSTMQLVNIPETDWTSSEIVTVEISQINLYAPVKLQFRKFKPRADDRTALSWWSERKEKTYEVPPYAIANLHQASQAYSEMIENNMRPYVEEVVRDHDDLIKMTYDAALSYMELSENGKEKNYMADVFRFWIACRITSNQFHIVGEETLGLSPISDDKYEMYGKVPLPPVTLPQEQVIIYSKFLIPLGQRIAGQLQKYLGSRKPETWYICYLSLFILLHSCSMITRRNWEYARELNLSRDYVNPDSIHRLQSSAITMLAHFHVIVKTNFIPLANSSDWEYLSLTQALTPDQFKFMIWTANMAKEKAENFQHLRKEKNFHDDMYWIAQLYDRVWSPDPQP